jgi:hypothetical protein
MEGGRDWWGQIEDALKSKALQHFVLIVTAAALLLRDLFVLREFWLAADAAIRGVIRLFLPDE